MKYIRTKDGVYKACELSFGQIIPVDSKDNAIENVEIVKQSDTIEELCDELVVFFDSNVRPVRVDKSIFWAKHYAGKTGHIMGAIWTDKGLIYVAKMNDKGELELL